jgi:hypothetical protein
MKIKWKKQNEIEFENETENELSINIEKFKDRKFCDLSSKEKDELLRLIALNNGLIKQ